MKSVKKYYISIVFLLLCCLIAHQAVKAQIILSPQDQTIKTDVERRAKEYSNLRERIEDQLPQLPKEATAEQIATHKTTFQKAVLSARTDAKQGVIFTPAAAKLIRKIIRTQYKGNDLLELRKAVFQAETKGIPLRVNFEYPEEKEQLEMPPVLLLNLPQLPKQLRYRFVGRNLLLVDRENKLIVDYMTAALP